MIPWILRKLLWKVKPKAQMDPGSSLCQVTRGWGGGGGARHGQGLGAYLIFSLCFANGAWKLLYKGDGPCPGFFSDWTGTKTQCHLAFSQTSERPLLPLNTSTFGTPPLLIHVHMQCSGRMVPSSRQSGIFLSCVPHQLKVLQLLCLFQPFPKCYCALG